MNALGFGGIKIPYKDDLAQHLFKDTDYLTPDGLYAKDYSGNDNNALLKSSYMCNTASGAVSVIALSEAITLLNTDDFTIELYFKFNASVGASDRFCFLGNRSTDSELAKIRFQQGNYIYFFGNANNYVRFQQFTDYTTLRKYTFRYFNGNIDFYVNDVFQQTQALSITGYTAHSLVGTYGETSVNGSYFDIKIWKNGSLIHYWPCQGGYVRIYDVVGDSHIISAGLRNETPLTQDLSHYNIKYGCDLWTNHAGVFEFVPKKMNGDSIILDAAQYSYWSKILDDTNPLPPSETVIQTLKGDISYRSIKADFNDYIFSNVINDQIYKDILIYNTAKSEAEVTTIDKYTKYNKFYPYSYNNAVLQDISTKIKTGNFEYIVLGDSIAPFLYRFHSQTIQYCSLKPLGFGIISTGNTQLGIYNDVRTLLTGSYEYIYSGATKDSFGINGVATHLISGCSVTIEPRNHKYTNIRILYAQNSQFGTFKVTIGASSWTIDCSGAQALGIFELPSDITEASTNIVLNTFTGDVNIFGFELTNSSGGGINHLCHHGGYTSQSFNGVANANYINDYCGSKADLYCAFIMLGTNDQTIPRSKATFKANIILLINQIRDQKTDLRIVLLTPMCRGLVEGQPEEDLTAWGYAREYKDALVELTTELTNVSVIDTAIIFPRYPEAFNLGWMLDVVHPTAVANEWLARQLYKVIMNS